jgi:hypothetical protein
LVALATRLPEKAVERQETPVRAASCILSVFGTAKGGSARLGQLMGLLSSAFNLDKRGWLVNDPDPVSQVPAKP